MGTFAVRAMGVGVLLCGLIGCSASEFRAAQSSTGSSSLSSEMDLSGQNSLKSDCQFIGVDAIASRLTMIFGISRGDVPILNDNGSASSMFRLASAASDLGAPNAATGKFLDLSCGMSKYKTSIEIFTDACSYAMDNPVIKLQLFPNGPMDSDHVYMSVIGRLPTSFEIAVLQELASVFPNGKKEAAVCAAVASSLESLLRI